MKRVQFFSEQTLVKFNQALEIGTGDELALHSRLKKSEKKCILRKLHCLPQRLFFSNGGVRKKFQKMLILGFEVIVQTLLHKSLIALFFPFSAHSVHFTVTDRFGDFKITICIICICDFRKSSSPRPTDTRVESKVEFIHASFY